MSSNFRREIYGGYGDAQGNPICGVCGNADTPTLKRIGFSDGTGCCGGVWRCVCGNTIRVVDYYDTVEVRIKTKFDKDGRLLIYADKDFKRQQ